MRVIQVIKAWVSDIYKNSGWAAAIFVLSALVVLTLIVLKVTGVNVETFFDWLDSI